MSSFDRLHPALQHHIVNSLGWRELRPFQEDVIPPIIDGQHLIVLAPTAGGKTEAAIFPTLSRMLSEEWSGLSVLYLCPIKALLNNLDVRLRRYCELLGRRSALWHGDVKQGARQKILREPPDCLLTTPESLEVVLVSSSIDARSLFRNLQIIIVDEIHAFAGDDRGWHLLSVLERISRLADRELQRIGLSATVGNPAVLSDWLAGSCHGDRDVYLPETTGGDDADVTLDYVGSLQNAAVVISRLHRGEKRLVFVDSRAKAEQLATQLKGLGVTTFVTHSSLSQEQRQQAEDAFATREDCVIVATSVLELGVDVGDLDRVIQIDSPATVASFLQRMGRTGRRTNSNRNCLFLATKSETLIQSAALIRLWRSGFVEPIVPPPLPFHILSQQLMALALQERGVAKNAWFEWVEGVQGFASLPRVDIESQIEWMLEQEILWDDEGVLWLGREGESTFGRKNFMDLFSVFMSPPLFSVLHGREELGYVDESSFLGRQDEPRVLLLGGNSWRVNYVDWRRRVAYVEATEQRGRTRWKGIGQGPGYDMSQAIKQVFVSTDIDNCWSERAREGIADARADMPWLDVDSNILVLSSDDEPTWWTFAGAKANAALAAEIGDKLGLEAESDSFSVCLKGNVKPTEFQRALAALREATPAAIHPVCDEQAVEGLKFNECLPPHLAQQMLTARLSDNESVAAALNVDLRIVVQN